MSRLMPRTALQMSDLDDARLAGFLDGEGTITLIPRRPVGQRPAIYCGNTVLAELEWCQRVTGAGHIYSLHVRPPSRLPAWMWQVHKILDIVAIVEQLFPYLITKKEAAQRVLTACEPVW